MEQACYKTELPPAFPIVFPGPVQPSSPWVGVGGGSLLFLVEYKVVQCQARLKTLYLPTSSSNSLYTNTLYIYLYLKTTEKLVNRQFSSPLLPETLLTDEAKLQSVCRSPSLSDRDSKCRRLGLSGSLSTSVLLSHTWVL